MVVAKELMLTHYVLLLCSSLGKAKVISNLHKLPLLPWFYLMIYNPEQKKLPLKGNLCGED